MPPCSGLLKIEQQEVTQWYTAVTQRCTVGRLVIENAMALRPEPLCTSVLPQRPSVLKLAAADY